MNNWTITAILLLTAGMARADIDTATTQQTADNRNYTLTVASAHGMPFPTPGTHSNYCWRSTVTCVVGSTVSEGGTNYTCTGWTGTGLIPAAGTTNTTGAIVLANVASTLVWQWRQEPVATIHVDAARPDDSGDGATLGTAKRTIQAGIAAASDGYQVLVHPGTYNGGVSVAKAVSVISSDGSSVTVIDGGKTNRCVSLSNRFAVLDGFTVANGAAEYGAGIYVSGSGPGDESAATVRNCSITGCTATGIGGGVWGGVIEDCVISGNHADYSGGGVECGKIVRGCTLSNNTVKGCGGGASESRLVNCRLQGNTAGDGGGGAANSDLVNCLVVGNTVSGGSGGGVLSYNIGTVTMQNCTVVGNFANSRGGVGAESKMVVQNCIIYGNTCNRFGVPNYDYYGMEPLELLYCCTSPNPSNGTGCFDADPMFVSGSDYQLQAGSPCVNAGLNVLANEPHDLGGNPRVGSRIVDIGAYERPGSYAAINWYVDASRPDDSGDGLTRNSAKHTIQAAADQAAPGDTILVGPGVYDQGGRCASREFGVTNRVLIGNAITVRAESSPLDTEIVGAADVRGVSLAGTGALLKGFTIRGGHAQYGAGVSCQYAQDASVQDSIIRDNVAMFGGGGVYFGRVQRSVIKNNSTADSGCGGGTLSAFLTGCQVIGNTAGRAGGVFGWELYNYFDNLKDMAVADNCVIAKNRSTGDRAYAAGAELMTLINCTVVQNISTAGYAAGGVGECRVFNSIVLGNLSTVGDGNRSGNGWAPMSYCCTSYVFEQDTGCFAKDPEVDVGTLFIDFPGDNYRLATNSICLDRGNYEFVTSGTGTDADGNARIRGSTVDVGAYEFQDGYCGLAVVSEYPQTLPAAGSHQIPSGTTLECAAPIRTSSGMSCTGWIGTGSVPATGSVSVVSLTLTRDSSITWLWVAGPASRTITLHPGAHGSISNENSGADYVATVTNGAAFPVVTVNAASGWTFTGWNPSAPATVTNDFEATAVYAVDTVTHHVTLNPGDHGSIAGANSGSNYVVTVTNGAAFPAVTVNAASGWTFTDWNPPAPATMTNDFEATAVYNPAYFVYTTSNSQITITGYFGPGGAVDIPSRINGLPVTVIGNSAFRAPVVEITSVTIPSGVTTIGNGAFYRCSKLTTVMIPSAVTRIGGMVFGECSELTSITVAPENPNFRSQDGVVFDKGMSTLICYPVGKTGAYSIPSGITGFGIGAFWSCTGLTGVTIPSSVTRLESGMFYRCVGLTDVTIPSNVTSIGDTVFFECIGLTSVTIPARVTRIEGYAFYHCSSLSSAIFLGNAPDMDNANFDDTASGFTVYYAAQNADSGFTSPTWEGYPALALAAPTVTTQPVPQSVAFGTTATFTAVADGAPVPTVQWQVSATGTAGVFTNIDSITNPSATNGTLILDNVAPAQNGTAYRAAFNNREGSCTSVAVALTLRSATHTVTLHPGAHGSIAGANAGIDYVASAADSAVFPAVTVNAASGWTFTAWNPPAPATVTNDFEATAGYQQITHTLTVVSAHGVPMPGVGFYSYPWSTEVDGSAPGIEEASLTRYLCTGWTGTGSVAPHGATTNTSFTITNDSSIVWNWDTEHRLSAETVGGQGWLSVTGAWVAAGCTATVSAVAGDGVRFERWLVDGEPAEAGTTNRLGGTNTITVSMEAPHTLTAEFAALGLPEALDNAGLVWTTGGASNWVGQTRVTFDGVDAAGSGMVSNNAQSWLETSVTNGGTLTFIWRVSSKEQGGLLRFEVDGEVYGLISGETTWRTNAVTVPYGSHTFRWTYAKGKSGAAGSDRGWVDQVVWTPLPPLTLAVALDATNLVWQTEGDAAWFPQTEVTADGIAAAQSGPVEDLGLSCLKTRVRGSGVLAFDWRVSCEEEYDWLVLIVDGVIQRATTGECDWQRVQLALGEGDHELRWEYWKDESNAVGLDAGWLDRVSWSGAILPQAGFALWLSDRGLSGDASALFGQDRNGDGMPNGFEYAFGTNLPSAGPLLNIRMVNGRPVVESPAQDTAAAPYVDLHVLGSTNLTDWTLPVQPAADTAGKPSNRDWHEPTDTPPGRAFFKLEALLK